MEYPLGPHCKQLQQLPTNVVQAARAELARLTAEHAAVPTAALEASHERAQAELLACIDAGHEFARGWLEHEQQRDVLNRASGAAFKAIIIRADEQEIMPRSTTPCPGGCDPLDWSGPHISHGSCTKCTTRDTESIEKDLPCMSRRGAYGLYALRKGRGYYSFA